MASKNIKYVGEHIISYVIGKCKESFSSITHKHTADEVGADSKGSAAAALGLAREYADDLADSKADISHNHDENYYTKTESDEKINTIQKNATSTYETKTDASSKLTEAKTYTEDKVTIVQTNLNTHINNVSNPHKVTKDQVGLGLVPNVSTNNQTPTYSDITNLSTLVSGEKLSVAFPKIKLAITKLIDHISNTENPHKVTKKQLGLENVDNTSDENKPISRTTQAALDTKSNIGHTHNYAGSSSVGGAANSATKLATARTINGVSFDGTSNISIVANPSTNSLENVDLNNYTTPGFYNGAGGNGCSNLPSTVDAFGMIVFKNAAGYTCQLLVSGSSAQNIMYLRTCTGSSWTEWVKQYSTINKPTPDDIGAATKTHGTHVTYSSTVPVMDGAASVGSATTVSRSDHKHPTDTSRAGKTEFDEHVANTTSHVASIERSDWNAAKMHADSSHAPANAEKNQNAFSNVVVGSTTVAADSATDTLTFVGSNVTITPDATNDKITFAIANGSTSAKGVVQLTNSTSSTSTTTAATPNSVKSAYDLANAAKTAAANAQTTADGKADVEHTHSYDTALSTTSTNPVQNKVVAAKVNSLQSSVDSKVPNTRTVNGKALTGDITLSASDVKADASGTADSKVSSHNTSTSAHADIRTLITNLTTRLNTLADSDDENLNQISEIVEYIKENRSLIEEVTASKISISEIVNNLTTNASNKPLSAAQGVAIKTLIDTLQSAVNEKADATHIHDIANVTGLQSALNGKSDISHTHDLSAMINTLGTGTSTPSDNDYYVSQYAGGGTTNTTYYRRPVSALWSYIKSKLSSVATSGSYEDLSNKPTIGNGTITITQNGTTKGTFTTNQSGNTTISLNNDNTKVTNTLATTTKAYVTGTTSATTNTGTQVFDTGVYLDTTAGQLTASTFKGTLSGNASSATKLATARTINGTSFDGSANITTSNWGTARTLTIGNTGKSVNGSGNVSWSLREIGAIANNPHKNGGTAGTAGYVAVAQLVITNSYVNRPIEFELIRRGSSTPCYVSVAFSNNSSTDPNIYSLTYTGTDYGVFIHKSDTSTWVLYATKSEDYDEVTVARVQAASQNITISYPSGFLTEKPTSNITNATLGGNIAYANKAGYSKTEKKDFTSGVIKYIPFVDSASDGYQKHLVNDGLRYWTIEGTTSSVGVGEIGLGNNVASGTAGNKKGLLYMYGTSSGYTEIHPGNNSTSNITLTLPSGGGTLARTSDNVASATKASQDGNGKVISSTYETKSDASSKLTAAKTYTDTVASEKSDITHNHDEDYDALGSANKALASAKSYTDSKTSGLASTTVVDNKISSHNTSTTAHNDIRILITALTTKVNNFLDVDDETTDQLSEVITLINNNKGTLESLTTSKINVSDIVNNLTTNSSSKVLSAAQGVVIKGLIDALQTELDSHTHAIADVAGLQSALDGKAASSHGTHVSYSSTTPVMDGTASVGTAGAVARSDHRHPVDTSRAAKVDFDSHTGNTTSHITSDERTKWNAAKTHADSAHAPSNAQANQNAFSYVKVGDTSVAADSTTDTLTLDGSNITITPDATNDKITFAIANGTTSTKGVVQLTNSTSSTSTSTAATPNSVKSAYDLANTAKTAAATAQATADSKADVGHVHNIATTSSDGFLSKSDKSKLDAVAPNATAVSFTRSLSSGTKVGTITIDGTGTDLYAPTNTDTHYTTRLKVGASSTATANASASNGSVYLNVLDNSTVRDSHKIVGSGATTVTSDASGNITINSTNTTYSAATSSTLGLVKSGTDITVDSSGNVSVNDDSHNHIIGNVDGLQATLDAKAVSQTLTSEDLNSVKTPGFYAAGANNSVTNKPSGVNYFGLQVIHDASGSYYTQLLYVGSTTYRRSCTNDTWSSWTQDVLTDTNTHYTSKNVIGSNTATSNTTSALANGNVYLNNVENGKVTSAHKISGGGATTVTSDASGNIVVSSTNTKYGVATTSSLGLIKSGTDITVDSSGNVSVNDDSHNHVISNIDNLQASLDAKSDSGHTHDDRYYTEDEVNTKLNGKSDISHTHDLSAMINTLGTGTSTPSDNDYYVSQYAGGGTTNTTYYRRPVSALWSYIKSKLATVAVSGSYNDLSNKPTIPTVGNGTITITQNGTTKGTFTTNQSGNTTIALTDTNTDTNTTYSAGRGIALSGTTFKLSEACTVITDWNNATTTGWYMGNGASNAPTTSGWYYGEVIAYSTNYVRQILYRFANNATLTDGNSDKFERIKHNGTWGSWVNTSVRVAVPSNAKFTDTNTWRGIQDNLTSTSTTDSLSANQGKLLANGAARDSTKLPLSGGTMTGNIAFSSIGDTATSKGISWSGSTDGASIYYRTDAADAGRLVLNLTDDSNTRIDFALNGTTKSYIDADGVFNGKATSATAASTATKLATARTINGTSFDGSANITTSNWGTARTLTIGNTGKSVNGSGNVSWSLREIGAIANNPHKNGGTAGTAGYVAVAQLVITNSYVNRPIEFELIRRGSSTPCYVSVAFSNNSSTDPNIYSLTYTGTDYGVFIHKSDTSTWVLYATKSEDYDEVTVARVQAASQNITISYPSGFLTEKPTSGITNATLGWNVKYAETSGSATKLGSSTIGGTAKPIYLNAGTATACSSTIGSATQPVYMNAGTITKCTYTLGKSVPSDAKFTDTTYGTATSSASGLMSAQDKAFLDFIKQFFDTSNPNKLTIGGANLVYDSSNGLKVTF